MRCDAKRSRRAHVWHADLNTTGHHASTGCIARRSAARRRPRAAPVPFRAARSTAKRLCICRWFKVGVVHSSSRLDRECRVPSRCRCKFRIEIAVTSRRSQLTAREAASAVRGRWTVQRIGSVWHWWRRYACEQDRCQDLLWLARICKAIPSDADVPPPTHQQQQSTCARAPTTLPPPPQPSPLSPPPPPPAPPHPARSLPCPKRTGLRSHNLARMNRARRRCPCLAS